MNALQQQLGGRIFHDYATSTQLQSFDNLIFLGGRSQQNDAHGIRRWSRTHFSQRLQTRVTRHCQIQKQNVGSELAHQFNCLSTIAGFTHDFQIRLGLEKSP